MADYAARIETLERERVELAMENASQNQEIKNLKKQIKQLQRERAATAEFKKLLDERESSIEILEGEANNLKQMNAESEMRVRDLERKIGVLEMKETEERSKRVRIEEEIEGLKNKIEELEEELIEKSYEMEEWMMEKVVLEEKTRLMEMGVVRLKEEAMESDTVVKKMKEKKTENRGGGAIDMELRWPVVATGSAGAIAAVAAMFYFCFGKRR